MLKLPPAVIIAGTHSGCGKTTITLALMSALVSRGFRVAPFKIGPDFIDPGLHELVCNRESYNLDSWMLSKEALKKNFILGSKDADLAIVEGVMGVFDGAVAHDEIGSTAHVAKILDLPVILVIDAKSMARSVSALLKGFLEFDKNLNIAGVILNKVGSDKHIKILKEALKPYNLPFLGFIKRKKDIKLPSRHLGLITATDLHDKEVYGLKKELAQLIENSFNLDRFVNFIRQENKKQTTVSKNIENTTFIKKDKKQIKVAVAYDKAFCFYYKRNLHLLQELGAKISYFSPIAGDDLPKEINGLYLGGGYPELYAKELSANKKLMRHISSLCRKGLPVLAECGGFMFMNKGIWINKQFFEWIDLFPLEFKMASRFQALGYRKVILKKKCLLGNKNLSFKGHEFRYSIPINSKERADYFECFDSNDNPVFTPGFIYKNTFASYIHIHFDSNQEVASSFVSACEDFSKK